MHKSIQNSSVQLAYNLDNNVIIYIYLIGTETEKTEITTGKWGSENREHGFLEH